MQKAALIGMALALATSGVSAAPLAIETVRPAAADSVYAAEGVVEAVRGSGIGAQLSGRVTALPVKAGDHVKSGQVLARIDERIAAQQALASQSQVAAAQAQLAAAQADYERQQRLYEQKFLSKAALERAESQYKSTAAQARAQIAEATAAGVQTRLHTLTAPYDGIVAETDVELGDMAMPGKPLMTMYDPTKLRVAVNLPQSQLARLMRAPVSIEIPGAATPSYRVEPDKVAALPTADAATHMVEVRIALPPQTKGLAPGMFARAMLPLQAAAPAARMTVPAAAVISRSELTAVYVVDAKGAAALRQVRLGRRSGERVEVLAGLDAGEKVALDPLAAAKQR